MEAAKIKQAVKHWVGSSDDDFKTMNNLFKSRDYAWALFVGHLVIEKLLKACYIKANKKHPIFIHNLVKIADQSNILLSEKRRAELASITFFNINGRYDVEKKAFHKMASKEFAKEWIDTIKVIRKWIKEEQLK